MELELRTDLERRLASDAELLAGLAWVAPRNRHPEGAVWHHVTDVFKNIDEWRVKDQASNLDVEYLRVAALLHDSFKYKVDTKKPKTGSNHHGMIARRFADKYAVPSLVLDIIELHDEVYNAWRVGNSNGDWVSAERRAKKLLRRIVGFWRLYFAFIECDRGGEKENDESLEWFVEFFISYCGVYSIKM